MPSVDVFYIAELFKGCLWCPFYLSKLCCKHADDSDSGISGICFIDMFNKNKHDFVIKLLKKDKASYATTTISDILAKKLCHFKNWLDQPLMYITVVSDAKKQV